MEKNYYEIKVANARQENGIEKIHGRILDREEADKKVSNYRDILPEGLCTWADFYGISYMVGVGHSGNFLLIEDEEGGLEVQKIEWKEPSEPEELSYEKSGTVTSYYCGNCQTEWERFGRMSAAKCGCGHSVVPRSWEIREYRYLNSSEAPNWDIFPERIFNCNGFDFHAAESNYFYKLVEYFDGRVEVLE